MPIQFIELPIQDPSAKRENPPDSSFPFTFPMAVAVHSIVVVEPDNLYGTKGTLLWIHPFSSCLLVALPYPEFIARYGTLVPPNSQGPADMGTT